MRQPEATERSGESALASRQEHGPPEETYCRGTSRESPDSQGTVPDVRLSKLTEPSVQGLRSAFDGTTDRRRIEPETSRSPIPATVGHWLSSSRSASCGP